MAKKQLYRVIFEDDQVLVVDKSAGLPVIRERNPKNSSLSLFNMLESKFERDLYLVHRIDKDTSGLVLFAKSQDSQRILQTAFQEGSIEKTYLAITEGRISHDRWHMIDAPLLKKDNSFKVSVHKSGKKAITEIRTIEVFKNASLIEAKILTGKTHQIRVHLSHIGFPLLVDPLYGSKKEFFLSELLTRKYKVGKDQFEAPLISRQTLHAQSLKFLHPSKNEKITFTSDLHKDMRAVLNQLRKIK